VGEDFIFLYKQIDEFSFFFAIALIRKYKNNPDVSITFINEKKKSFLAFLSAFLTPRGKKNNTWQNNTYY